MNNAKAKPKAKAQVRQQPASAPKGAKRRATRALTGKSSEGLSEEEIRSFWDARLHKLPPAIRTTFGNFTTINLVERFVTTVPADVARFIWIPWTRSGLCALRWDDNGITPTSLIHQHYYNLYALDPPTSIRPLRMTVSIENVGQLINSGGDVSILSVDQAIRTDFGTSPSGATTSTWITPSWASGLLDAAPDAVVLPIATLTDEHRFISAPASYPGYNDYYPYLQNINTIDNTGLTGEDIYNLSQNPTPVVNYPGALVMSTGEADNASLGSVPPLRGFLIMIRPGGQHAQTLRVQVNRQDGARYAVNTLGHSFAHCPEKMGAKAEDAMLSFTRAISHNPSVGMKSNVMDRLGSFANNVAGALAGHAADATLNALAGLAKPLFSPSVSGGQARALQLMLT